MPAMHPYLMRSPCINPKKHKRVAAKFSYNLVSSFCGLSRPAASGAAGKAQPVFGVSKDNVFYNPLLLRRRAAQNGGINLFYPPSLKLPLQRIGSLIESERECSIIGSCAAFLP